MAKKSTVALAIIAIIGWTFWLGASTYSDSLRNEIISLKTELSSVKEAYNKILEENSKLLEENSLLEEENSLLKRVKIVSPIIQSLSIIKIIENK